jgi:hypothetical protein
LAEFEATIIGASAIGSQPSRGAVLHTGASCVAECRVRIDLAQLPTRHLFGPTAGTARGFALGEEPVAEHCCNLRSDKEPSIMTIYDEGH